MEYRNLVQIAVNFLLLVLFRAIRFFLRMLPPCLMLAMAARAGWIVGKLCRSSREVMLAQMRFVAAEVYGESPTCSAEQIETFQGRPVEELCDQIFSHFGECIGEMLIIDRLYEVNPISADDKELSPVFKYITAAGGDLVAETAKSPHGAVGLSAHLGCFELLAAYLVRSGVNVAVVSRVSGHRIVNQLLSDLRASYGANIIWRRRHKQARAALQAVRALQNGQVLAAIIDHDTNVQNTFSSFFGIKAAAPVAPIALAVKHNLPVITSFIVRTKRLHHHVITEEIRYDPQDEHAAQKILDTYNQRLEALIRKYPEQWLWWNRRWRRRPGFDYVQDGRLLRSKAEYLSWLNLHTQARIRGEITLGA